MVRFPYRETYSNLYQTSIPTPAELHGKVSREHLAQLVGRLGVKCERGKAGYASESIFLGREGAKGFVPAFDLNGNGEIDFADAAIVEENLGREVRYNLYLDGYFGGDWLSTSCCLDVEHRPGVPLIADYEFGGGYDSAAGIIRLLESPGPDQPVWVEYFYDAPAEMGEGNIRVHLYRERP
jgi:hypothetical protein